MGISVAMDLTTQDWIFSCFISHGGMRGKCRLEKHLFSTRHPSSRPWTTIAFNSQRRTFHLVSLILSLTWPANSISRRTHGIPPSTTTCQTLRLIARDADCTVQSGSDLWTKFAMYTTWFMPLRRPIRLKEISQFAVHLALASYMKQQS